MQTDLCSYRGRPLALIWRYVARRPLAHAAILACVLGAVFCSIGVQYGIKRLVDSLAGASSDAIADPWPAYLLLAGFIAGDNLLWRGAGWIASPTYVGVTGDLRSDIFRHLTGHAPGYFSDRLPGMLTSRITATSNAVFTVENMFVWNVLPPCVATFAAIALDRHRQSADGGDGRGCRRCMVMAACSIWPRPASRCTTISPTRPPRSTARWSMSSTTCRWCGRSAAFGCEHDRFDATVERRNEGAQAQPALSRKAAAAHAVRSPWC